MLVVTTCSHCENDDGQRSCWQYSVVLLQRPTCASTCSRFKLMLMLILLNGDDGDDDDDCSGKDDNDDDGDSYGGPHMLQLAVGLT